MRALMKHSKKIEALPKCPTGITGLDEITHGGLPRGRPTLVCGGAGCGKSLMGMEFLVRGATTFGEPGVLMTFEESAEDVTKNVASLGFDLEELTRRKRLVIDHVHVERNEIEESGEYDLEALFIRLNHAIDSIGAKRVVLDTLETLFSGLSNQGVLRSELRRLFQWLKDKGVTAIITGEQGDAKLTRQGLEEYVSDCVIFLDHRIIDQISTRRLRVVKYRGSVHGTNEYPYLIDETGFSVLPVTSLGLNHAVSNERISSGVAELDQMLGGKGYYRGSTILLSGSAGSGKSSLAAHFAHAACAREERCLYFAFEESPKQIIRNMRSIGLNLQRDVDRGFLRFHASRPSFHGLETHLATIHKVISDFRPDVVVMDPISNLTSVGTGGEVNSMILRLIDFLKSQNITTVLVNLNSGGKRDLEATDIGISSLMDTWILLRDIELGGERNRGIYILKSRGMAHSNQIREFLLTSQGIRLIEAYLGPEGVLTGSMRLSKEAQESASKVEREQEVKRRQRELERQRQLAEAQILAIRAAYEAQEAEMLAAIRQQEARAATIANDRQIMAQSRHAGPSKTIRKSPVQGTK